MEAVASDQGDQGPKTREKRGIENEEESEVESEDDSEVESEEESEEEGIAASNFVIELNESEDDDVVSVDCGDQM